MIKVSIIVCVYNMEKYLKQCLDSLVSQTLKDIEIIIVNDGSTDSSLEIIDEYKKRYSFIKVIKQKNMGLGGARNTGLSAAKGQYVGFVDSDDFVSESMYEKLYLKAQNENADLIISNYEFYPQEVKNKKRWFKEFKGRLDANFIDKNTQPWNKLVSKKLLDDINFKFFDKNGDGAYINVFLNAKKIVTLNEKLYFYRVGHSSMSTNHSIEKYDMEIKIALEQKKMLLKKDNLVDELEEYFNYRIIYTYIQAISVAALLGRKDKFLEYKGKLNSLNFRENIYLKTLLKEQFDLIKYYGIVNILPKNYYISKFITKIIM